MKICSWNINSIRVRVDALNLLIEKINPDIILLQEIKCENHQFTEYFKNFEYNLIVKGQKGRHGVAILIKKNIDFTQIQITSNIMNKEARICGVSLKNIFIFNVYVPNGNPIENITIDDPNVDPEHQGVYTFYTGIVTLTVNGEYLTEAKNAGIVSGYYYLPSSSSQGFRGAKDGFVYAEQSLAE